MDWCELILNGATDAIDPDVIADAIARDGNLT